jgi:hypothetical protein
MQGIEVAFSPKGLQDWCYRIRFDACDQFIDTNGTVALAQSQITSSSYGLVHFTDNKEHLDRRL